MPSGTNSRRKKKTSFVSLPQFFALLLRFVLSPAVLFWDSFRRRGTLEPTWVFSFFLLITVLLLLTGAGIFISEAPLNHSFQMLSDAAAGKEIVPGDAQPVIHQINVNAASNNLDPTLVYAIIKTESHFRERAVSPAGAKGLMQLMPDVWNQYKGVSTCSGQHGPETVCGPECIFTPEANIGAGTKYLKTLVHKYDGRIDLVLEAYNAGAANVEPGQQPRYQETRGYVEKAMGYWQDLKRRSLNHQLQLFMGLQDAVKWLFGAVFVAWILLFWWASRKVFPS